MPRRFTGARLRRNVVVLVAAMAVLATIAVARFERVASAEQSAGVLTLACVTAGLASTVPVPVTATDEPDPVEEGSPVALVVQVGAPDLSGFSATVTGVHVTLPTPPQVAVSGVSFTGGNLTGSAEVSPGAVELAFSGEVASSDAQLPSVTVSGTVGARTAGQALDWPAPTAVVLELVTSGTYFSADCAPATTPPPLNSTMVVPATSPTSLTTTTTRPTTTTTTSTTTTTRPTTTTTRATTTTTRSLLCRLFGICPTTTTTRPPTTTTTTTRPTTTTTTTTTTRPTTTTTRPTTTTAPSWLCWWFGIC